MNNKMTTNSQLSTTEPKKKKKRKKRKEKQKLSKQLEQEQNQINGDHMVGFQWGGRGEDLGGKLQEIRSIIGRHKIDRERLRMV